MQIQSIVIQQCDYNDKLVKVFRDICEGQNMIYHRQYKIKHCEPNNYLPNIFMHKTGINEKQMQDITAKCSDNKLSDDQCLAFLDNFNKMKETLLQQMSHDQKKQIDENVEAVYFCLQNDIRQGFRDLDTLFDAVKEKEYQKKTNHYQNATFLESDLKKIMFTQNASNKQEKEEEEKQNQTMVEYNECLFKYYQMDINEQSKNIKLNLMETHENQQAQTQGNNQQPTQCIKNQQKQNYEGEAQIIAQSIQIVNADQDEEEKKDINIDIIDLGKSIGQQMIQTLDQNPECTKGKNADTQQECNENKFGKPIKNSVEKLQEQQKQIDQDQKSEQDKINKQSQYESLKQKLIKQKQLNEEKQYQCQPQNQEILQQNDDLEKLCQSVARSKHGLSSELYQSKIMTHEDLMSTVKRKEIKKEIIFDCEGSLYFLRNNPKEFFKFCFKENTFGVKRLKQGNDDLTEMEFLSGLTKLASVGSGKMSEGCTQYHDQVDINFGSEYVFKEMKFTEVIDQYKAYKELSILNYVNVIPNGENYFAQLHCCFIKKNFSQEFKIVFVLEFGRNSLGQMLRFKRKYSEYELMTIMKHLLEMGGLLEQYHIAQNDIKLDNIILNRHFNNVKVIDFGVAIRVSKTKNPDLKKKLKWRGGSPAYASPQMQAAYLQFCKDEQKQHNQHCLQYLSPPRYSPFKSDVYSVAVTICQMAGINIQQDMIFCFKNRSEGEKQHFLESHFKCKELAHILYNMLLNNEDQRWSFEKALHEINKAITAINQSSIFTLIQPNLIEETEKSFIKVAKLAFKDQQELKRSNQGNCEHFNKMFSDNYDAGAFDDALFYAEKSLFYAQGYPPLSDKDKLIMAFLNKGICLDKLYALLNIGICLYQLKRFEEAALVCQQAFDYLNSIKGQFINKNDYYFELGKCLYRLGSANDDLNKNEEALRNCDDALTALCLNNQQQLSRNEQLISGIYNQQALIYSDQKNFAAAKLKYQQFLQIAIKNNQIKDQAICYNNMFTLKMRQNELYEEALQFVNNAIQLYTKHFNGQNNTDVLMVLFNKCIVQCNMDQIIYYSTLELAFQTAKSVKGGGRINKQYADYIKERGELCIHEQFKVAMTNVAFKNHAIRLFKEAQRVYNILNDQENAMEMQQQTDLLEKIIELDQI